MCVRCVFAVNLHSSLAVRWRTTSEVVACVFAVFRLCVCSVSAHYRVAKTHRIPYAYRSFSAKVTYI